LEGDILVTVQVEGEKIEVPIKQGDMFLLPANIPHNPVRSANSIGLVIERVRKGTNMKDGLLWFCDNCNNKLHETYFSQENIETDFQSRFKEFYNSKEKRTCSKCNSVMDIDERFL
jgi:3-hydroxyanthranilate 3,4-dioxygenase